MLLLLPCVNDTNGKANPKTELAMMANKCLIDAFLMIEK